MNTNHNPRPDQSSIKLLDCTLRDGGHVNSWNFGRANITSIINHLVRSSIDIIELGLIKSVDDDPDSTIKPTLDLFEAALPELISDDSQNPYFTVMIRPDWIDKEIFKERPANAKIKGLRFAFYPEDIQLTYDLAARAKDKGYDIFLNPVGITTYTNSEISATLIKLRELQPIAFSIVDTFGAMNVAKLDEIYPIFEDNVFETTTLGLHLHENQSLALSIALHFLKIRNPKRPIIIDASLLGMGRIPGNLCIEQIANELNTLNLSNYCTTEIYEAIYKYIAPIKSQTPWGYSPEYMISAMSNVNRNYSEFLKDGGLPLSRFPEALNYIKQNDTFGMKFNSKLASKCLDLFKVNP